MDLHFMSAPGGSAFMHELVTAVAHEVSHCIEGTSIRQVHIGEGPLTGGPDDVFVVVPHEFFRVLPPHLLPDEDQCRRTIGFCVEHPGTATFATTLAVAGRLGACVDINDDSAFALRAAGTRVERFHLGYTALWDQWHGTDHERSCDVLYLGTADDRRSRFLSLCAKSLNDHEVRFATPPHEPMTRPRPDFFMGAEKHRLLADSRVLLNLHREESTSFEWVRALEAMSNGCVVVTEHSRDHQPLVPGEHFVAAAPHAVGEVARALLEQPERLAAIRDQAYELIRTDLTMRTSADMLVQLALSIDAPHTLPSTRVRTTHRAWPVWPIDHPPPTHRDEPEVEVAAVERPADRAPVRRAASRASRRAGSCDVIVLPAVGAVADESDVVALRAELSAAGDGDGSVFVTPSLADANDALSRSDADHIMVIDATECLLPLGLARLQAPLARSEFDAVYGFVITPSGTFRSQWPFEPQRVLDRNYLAAASLWRRSSLWASGGWDDTSASTPAATWDLWRRHARRGGTAFHLPRPVAVQRSTQPAPRSPSIRHG